MELIQALFSQFQSDFELQILELDYHTIGLK